MVEMFVFQRCGSQICSSVSTKIILILMILNLTSRCAAHRIAIIGGGIGGTASAYYLNQLMEDADIDVFESGEVGGRLAVAKIGGREYEAGGAILHPRNMHMQHLVQQLGLSHRKEQQNGLMGFYDGKEFVFSESDSSWMTMLKLVWRYGMSLWTMDNITKNRLQHFERIYSHQDKGASFSTVAQLLDSMSPEFVPSAQMSARKGFIDGGMSERLVNELLAATLRINYGQSVDTAHEFVGFVSVAAADGGLWSVEGGNYQVPRHLLAASGANLISGRVLEVRALEQAAGYNVTWLDALNEENSSSYDAVILALPITDDYKYKVVLPKLEVPIPKRQMHRLYVTFVQGEVNYTNFGITSQDGIQDVVALWDKPFFNCVGKVNPVDGSELDPDETTVYKVFSSTPLNHDELDLLFSRRDSMLARDFLAYPHYSHEEPLDGSFVLRDGLFYINAIEWAASAMEMSAIGAKNVALLTRNFLRPEETPNVDITSAANKLEL